MSVRETQDATKQRISGDDALSVLAGVDRVIAMKGKSVVEFDLSHDRPDDETLRKHLIGPTGNLRAPTARAGKTLYVGFNEEGYRKMFKSL